MVNPLSEDNPLSIVLPPILWSAYFLAVYVINALRCAKGWTATLFGVDLVEASIIGATLVTLVLLVALGLLYWRRYRLLHDAAGGIHATDPHKARQARRRFMAVAGLLQVWLAVAATAYVALPVLMVPGC